MIGKDIGYSIMTKFQWSVVIALCRIVLDMKYDWCHLSGLGDTNLLHDAIDKESNKNE